MSGADLTVTNYLAADVEKEIREQISSGVYAVGDKLPTEAALGERFGVSRTVIREALAGLRSSGLVRSRRGSGIFVQSAKGDFSADALFSSDWPKHEPDVIDALELRAAVEIQSVAYAAVRASSRQMAEIADAHDRFIARIENRLDSTSEDYAFHVAIARATNNRYFEDFLSEASSRTIPRSNLSLAVGSEAHAVYLSLLASEHQAIMDALEARDPEAAATSMRIHLQDTLVRYTKSNKS